MTTITNFSDIKGHENIKRAIEIAIFGKHTITIFAVPGHGASSLQNCAYLLDHKFHTCSRSFFYIVNSGQERIESEMMLEMNPLSPEQFFSLRKSENTESILYRLNEAKNNPEPSDKLNDACYVLAKNAMQRLSLTPKRMSYVFSIAKTIARLEGVGSKFIEPHHIAEAVLYQNIHGKI